MSRDGVKVLATLFSPAPWLKTATGARFMEGGGVLPRSNTPFPFVWNGNFAGGQLDVSHVPLAVFFDGVENTSALTQFARSTAAYLRAFQNAHGVPVYAVGIQNELNFEHYFYSCKYALAEQLAAALVVLRAELDRYPDLAPIRIIGPEDLLIDTPYALWQFGGGASLTHKNLRFLHELEADPQAWGALDFVAVHGSPSEQTWRWWADGWQATPTGTLPAQVRGFRAFGKKSWMTETSGHADRWPTPSEPADDGALAVALAIHRALTVGEESAWLHWQFMDPSAAGLFALTDPAQGNAAPKYVAVKHFARFIRPGAERIDVRTSDAPNLYASGYVHEADHQLTLVLVNADAEPLDLEVAVPWGIRRLYGFSSDASTQFARDVALVGRNRTTTVRVPAHGVVTLVNAGRRGW